MISLIIGTASAVLIQEPRAYTGLPCGGSMTHSQRIGCFSEQIVTLMYENGYFEALEAGYDQGFFDGAMDFYQFLLTHDWSA